MNLPLSAKRSSPGCSVFALLVIQAIERFFWVHWFLSLTRRTTVGVGILLFVTYLLPVIFAPLVNRIGCGRGLLAGMLLYALSFLTTITSPALGLWLVVAASAVYKTSFGPTLSECGDNRAYTRLYFVVNLASGASAFAYGWLHQNVELSRMDAIACSCFALASLLAISLRRISRAKLTVGSGSVGGLVVLAFCQLPLFVCSWKFQTDYRISLDRIFVAAGLPEEALWGTVCIAVMLCSYVLGTKRFAELLKDGKWVIVLAATTFATYFILAGYTNRLMSSSVFLPFIILAESIIFSVADSLLGAVSQRLMIEAAPSKALGSAGYFCLIAVGSLISYLIGSPISLPFVLAGVALLTAWLMASFLAYNELRH